MRKMHPDSRKATRDGGSGGAQKTASPGGKRSQGIGDALWT